MSANWRFKDEWLLRSLAGLEEVLKPFIARMRAEKKIYLSHALLDSGLLTEEQLGQVIKLTLHIKTSPMACEDADKFGLALLKESDCRKYQVIPLEVTESEIRLAMANPIDLTAQSDVEALTARRVVPVFVLPLVVDSCLDHLFNSDKVISDLLKNVEFRDEVQLLEEVGGEGDGDGYSSKSGPIVALVNSIISTAHRKRSSDIHIEHEQKNSHVRIRVDGLLRNIMTLPRAIAAGPLVSRIKIMANLDVSNRLRPQDGSARINIGGVEVGLRVSTLPTSFGEKAVIRILDQRTAEVPFNKLGFAPEVALSLEACLGYSQGMILVTGPTGSGKTTTLYSMLNKTRHEATNIVTVEDPIEYKLPGVNQVQVNEKQGLTFAAVLRSVLRQDPDVIMVGEIRDRETADIAFQAAMTGHLVFSTLHTNGAVSTIARLADMGVDRFKLAPSILAIISQRLVRRLCPGCIQKVPEAEANKALLAAMESYGFERGLFRSVGCKDCDSLGYAGRTALVEVLEIQPRLRDLINSGALPVEILKTALQDKALRTLTQDALWHLSRGHTSLAEAAPYLDLTAAAPVQAERRKAQPHAPPAPKAEQTPAQPAAHRPHAPHAAEGHKKPLPHTPPPKAHPVSPPPPPPRHGKLRVMIAEDNDLMRMLLKKFIKDAGFEPVLVADGKDAMAAIVAGPVPDLLVADINMPRMNGYELIRCVRETLNLPGMPVIVLTTNTTEKSQELAFKLGADDYISKPFNAALFVARIRAVLRRGKKIK